MLLLRSTVTCSLRAFTTKTCASYSMQLNPFTIRSLSTADPSTTSLLEGFNLDNEQCNVTPNIASRLGTNLHHTPNHPLCTIKTIIQDYFGPSFTCQDNLSPIVSVEANFDSLLIPPDHVSRSKSDTYYLNDDTVLRCHTSAHQTALLKQGLNRFLVTGDVYRRDEVDSSHYPVFHQMEGVKLFTKEDYKGHDVLTEKEQVQFIEDDLKRSLEGMASALFGNVEMRWVDEYFPFTDPSFELEIYFKGEWMEVLGCGVIREEIIANSGRDGKGWAFGLGLERLAMVLFGIPDIRLFWTQDERFHSQFIKANGKIITFVPYSKYPPCYKDISFWTPSDGEFHPNDVHELVRTVAGDLVEKVELIDSFEHPKTKRLSNCFRISYRSMDRSLTNEEVDALQEQVRSLAVDELNVELR